MSSMTAPAPAEPSATPQASERTRPYAFYALLVLISANFFNYVDRHIMSIVAESLKADLALSDAELGFLLGTAFAVLYGVVGLPMGRVSDAISRTKLMAGAMAFWSAMTALTGFATNFLHLAVARIGVGLGEAAANPCSHSLLADYFPEKNRTAAMGAYLIGTYAGMGFSLYLGGLVVAEWATTCQALPLNACAIANWQAAFLIVGLPGLLVALLVYSLREPPRASVTTSSSFLKLFGKEMSAVVPPLTLVTMTRVGGTRGLLVNLALLATVATAALLLAVGFGDWLQWLAVGVGIYCVGSWIQMLHMRDRPLFALTFGCPTFRYYVAGCSIVMSVNNTIPVWAAPFAMRQFGMDAAQAGLQIGLTFALAAGIGVTGASLITDRWRRFDRRAPMWVAIIALLVPMPILWVMLTTTSSEVFVIAFFFFGLIGMSWGGASAATAQDLVLPRMRGSAAASFSLTVILTSLSIGPYAVGKISTMSGSLSIGLVSLQVLVPLGLFCLIMAARRFAFDAAPARLARARAVGEPG